MKEGVRRVRGVPVEELLSASASLPPGASPCSEASLKHRRQRVGLMVCARKPGQPVELIWEAEDEVEDGVKVGSQAVHGLI